MTLHRLLLLAILSAAILGGCSNYKQVDDSSDNSNGKFKHHPSDLAR